MRGPRGTWRRIAAVLAVLVLLAAACGGGDDDDGAAGADDAAVDPNGVLKVPLDLSIDFGLDPATIEFPGSHLAWIGPVYGSLLQREGEDGYRPQLAEDVEVVDASTIRVVLRDGLTFHDGTTLDAQAVKFNLERNKAANNARGHRVDILGDLDHVEVVDDLTAVIHLKNPTAGTFYDILADGETYIASPTAAAAGTLRDHPVGAGPFRFVSKERGARIVYEKNPDYYDADNVRLAGIEIVNVTPDALENAVRSGTVDFADLPYTFTGAGDNFTVERNPTIWYMQWMWCKNRPPFDDKRVRQAMNYAIDRQAIADQLFGGDGQPAWGMWPDGHRLLNEDLVEYYDHDPEKAKQLLREAGYDEGELRFGHIINTTSIQLVISEVMQAQLADIGVTMDIVVSQNIFQDYYRDARQPSHLLTDRRPYLDKMTNNTYLGSLGNPCGDHFPEVEQIGRQIAAVPRDSDEAQELWFELQEQMAIEDVVHAWVVFPVEVFAWNHERLGDFEWWYHGTVTKTPDWTRVYIKE